MEYMCLVFAHPPIGQRASALQLADQLAARLPSADYWHRLDAEAHTTALRILSTASHLARQLAAWSDDIVRAVLPWRTYEMTNGQ